MSFRRIYRNQYYRRFSKDDLKIYFDIGSLTDKEDMLENITNLSYPKDIIKHARVALLEYWAERFNSFSLVPIFPNTPNQNRCMLCNISKSIEF